MSRHIKAENVSRGDLPSIPPSEIVVVHSENTRQFAPQVDDLVESFKQHGQIQPCIVRPLPDGRVQLVAGYRRWTAAMQICREQEEAGIPVEDRFKLACEVKKLSAEEALDVNIVENSERQDLSPIESAMTIRRLRNQRGWTDRNGTKKIATLFRRSESWVGKTEELLALSSEEQEEVHKYHITKGREGISFSVAEILRKVPEEKRSEALEQARIRLTPVPQDNIPSDVVDPLASQRKGNAHIKARNFADIAAENGATAIGKRDSRDLIELVNGYFDGGEKLYPFHPMTKRLLGQFKDFLLRRASVNQLHDSIVAIDGCLTQHYDEYSKTKPKMLA